MNSFYGIWTENMKKTKFVTDATFVCNFFTYAHKLVTGKFGTSVLHHDLDYIIFVVKMLICTFESIVKAIGLKNFVGQRISLLC